MNHSPIVLTICMLDAYCMHPFQCFAKDKAPFPCSKTKFACNYDFRVKKIIFSRVG